MRKAIDYQALCTQASKVFRYIQKRIEYITSFEVPQEVVEELVEIVSLLQSGTITFPGIQKNPYKHLFESYIENMADIKDQLERILFITSQEGKDLLVLPVEEREEICEELNVPFIENGFEGLSDDLRFIVRRMHQKVKKMEKDATSFMLPNNDGFADFEDELKPAAKSFKVSNAQS